MGVDKVVAGPSLFLARTEKAHREHQHQHNFFHHHHINDKRQTATQIDIQQVVTEVTQTISYVQQIDVDSAGNTFSIQTVLASPTSDVSTTSDTAPSIMSNATPAATITDPASSSVSNTASSASSTSSGTTNPSGSSSSSASQSLRSNSSTSSAPTTSASSIPTSSFALLTVASNSTTYTALIPVSSSQIQSQSFSNSNSNSTLISSSSSAISSFTYLTSSNSNSASTSTSASGSASSDIYSSYDPSASSTSTDSFLSSGYTATPTASGSGGTTGLPGATGTTTGTTSSGTGAAGNGSDSGSSDTVSSGAVAGGVVGGVAGAALLIFLLMFFLKWHKRQNMFALGNDTDPGAARAVDAPPPTQPPGGMSGPQGSLFAVPAALASLVGRKKAIEPVAAEPEERGFYRVSGRKLPSVLQSGGDGYGDEMPGNTLSGSSFYRDSQGFYGGSGSGPGPVPVPGSPTLAPPVDTSRPISGIPIMRPSPARTPVTEHPFSFGPAPMSPTQRDLAGRSLISRDGSHTSRFTEEV